VVSALGEFDSPSVFPFFTKKLPIFSFENILLYTSSKRTTILFNLKYNLTKYNHLLYKCEGYIVKEKACT
jgi:hypothetical protein